MSDENKSRRCSFELFPDERTGDKIADELIANEKLKERGRFMRAMLVTGAAFAAIDKRLPLLISELLTENTTLDDINKVISSVIPGAFSVEKKLRQLCPSSSAYSLAAGYPASAITLYAVLAGHAVDGELMGHFLGMCNVVYLLGAVRNGGR